MKQTRRAALPGLILLIASMPAHATPACSAAALGELASKGTAIRLAKAVDAAGGVPAYCLVEGTMPTQDNVLRFRLGLPQQWNGDFLFQGAGGMVGLLMPIDAGLKRGYAVATTDTGHQGTPVDVAWALNSLPKKIDWAYRAVHVTTVGAKLMVQAYYGSPIRHAVLEGVSNGGRQGLMEAQRYPADYDGVIAGAPAISPTVGILGWIWNLQVLSAAPEKLLTPQDWAVVGKAIRAECDGKDGLVDGLIEDARRCEVPLEKLQCQGARTEGCLSEAQVGTLRKLWNKPRLDDGQTLFEEGHGYEDDPSVWSWYAAPPGGRSQQAVGLEIVRNMFLDNPHAALSAFDVERDGPALIHRWSGIFDASNPNLTPYLKRGSRLLLWQGWADAAIPPQYAINYFWRARGVAQQLGLSAEAFDQAVRLYMVPAMPHGPGIGPWPTEDELLAAMEQWLDSGAAPLAIPVRQRDAGGVVTRSRPLCPMPLVARYTGQGPVDDAASFRCVEAESKVAP